MVSMYSRYSLSVVHGVNFSRAVTSKSLAAAGSPSLISANTLSCRPAASFAGPFSIVKRRLKSPSTPNRRPARASASIHASSGATCFDSRSQLRPSAVSGPAGQPDFRCTDIRRSSLTVPGKNVAITPLRAASSTHRCSYSASQRRGSPRGLAKAFFCVCALAEAEVVPGEDQRRGVGPIHFLQRDDVGRHFRGVFSQGREVGL